MITIGAPSPRANWYAGSSQDRELHPRPARLKRPVHDLAGEQRRHLVLGQPVKPVAGQSSYSVKVPASVPAATGYQLVVRWRADPAVATWQSRATLSGLAVAADPVITIGAPSSGASWATGKSYTVSWTIDQAVWAASSSIWLVSSAGTWYLGQPVNPLPAQTSFGPVKVSVNVPAGSGYQVVVRWRADPTVASWQSRATLSGLAVT